MISLATCRAPAGERGCSFLAPVTPTSISGYPHGLVCGGRPQQRRAPRARAWAASGEVMGEGPLCAYSRQSQMASWERTTRVLVSR
jgi:hypothetical protein